MVAARQLLGGHRSDPGGSYDPRFCVIGNGFTNVLLPFRSTNI